ncbi:MAG: endonuclease [Paludibacter sp.]|nr:endonuclease [Paludibacter sp.]
MNKFLVFVIVVFLQLNIFAQEAEKRCFKVLCYNVENYFDCIDDTLTNDSEYLPGGIRAWNNEKYRAKQANIAKVITAVGGWDAPALVGLCEIESRKCLIDLTRFSGLKNLGYKFVHYESPDARGVDVALLYQPHMFKPIHNEAIRIKFPTAPQSTTRDILFVSGVLPTHDTLHVFVCHFPSRLSGELESEERRWHVAAILRLKIDSIFAANNKPNILIMGDFNDYPTNNSMLKVLKALPPEKEVQPGKLYNLMFSMHLKGKGSHKHQGEWGALDQIIVSGNLLHPASKMFTLAEDAHVFDADFLLVADEKFLGKQPFRTYIGMKYTGGFADHLPVYVDFWY